MEFLRFQRTFHKKSFGPGLGRKPQLTTNTKNADKSAFFILSEYVGTAVPSLRFKKLLKKLLKNPQNFRTDYTILFCIKLLKFQETFLEKFLVSGVWG